MKRLTAWGLALLTAFFVFFGAAAEKDPEASEFPLLNEDGFLDEGEFVDSDNEEGLWRYASSTLWVEIHRIIQPKPARTWYEAEIRCAAGSEMPHMIPSSRARRLAVVSASSSETMQIQS